MTREEFIKQRCEIDKITEEEFEKRYRVVKCNCGQPYCKGYRCLDLDGLLKENQKLKKKLHEASLTIQEMTERDIECPSNCEKLRQLKKQLEDKEDYINKLQATKDKLDKWDYENTMQQKEFIKYLEDMLDNESDIFSVVRVKDALQKYKQIIGADNSD
mgnify:CR=1 FL=1|jgi:hypothetical protein